MNKNTLIGSILIAVIVIWWMAVNNANAEAQAAARAAQAKEFWNSVTTELMSLNGFIYWLA